MQWLSRLQSKAPWLNLRRELTALVAVLLAALVIILARREHWKPITYPGAAHAWRHENVIHLDMNGDYRVDEERVSPAPPQRPFTRKDTDFDGWFDLRYEEGPLGIALNIRKIHERAPQH